MNTTDERPHTSYPDHIFQTTIEVLRRQRETQSDIVVQLTVELDAVKKINISLEHTIRHLQNQNSHMGSKILNYINNYKQKECDDIETILNNIVEIVDNVENIL